MAKSKKGKPSFEIPTEVRETQQSGWVYRSDQQKKAAARHPEARAPHAPTVERHAAKPAVRPNLATREAVAKPTAAAGPARPTAAEPHPPVRTTPIADAAIWSGSLLTLGARLMAAAVIAPAYVGLAVTSRLSGRPVSR